MMDQFGHVDTPDLVAFIDKRLHAMFSAPPMFGRLETIEFNTVTLLELEFFARKRYAEGQVLKAWQAYLKGLELPRPNVYLSGQDGMDYDLLVRHLKAFVHDLRTKEQV